MTPWNCQYRGLYKHMHVWAIVKSSQTDVEDVKTTFGSTSRKQTDALLHSFVGSGMDSCNARYFLAPRASLP